MNMRLKSFINENNSVAHTITKECSTILSVMWSSNKSIILYRGTKKPVSNGAQKFIPRQDRRPVDMPIEIHDVYDKLFYGKFGWYARSEGVFASGQERISYGPVYMFFPVNGYKYVWSPAIYDLYTSKYRLIENVQEGFDTYIDKDLKRAIRKGHEITFKCSAYWMVDMIEGLDIIHELGKLNQIDYLTDYVPTVMKSVGFKP